MTALAADLAFHRCWSRLFLTTFRRRSLSMNINEITEAKYKKRRKKKAPYSSMSITTGDIGLNIDRFNQAMGTDFGQGATDGSGAASEAGNGGALCEAKRYVRRYYIRPQNIFCSNKAEILKALIELDDTNCSVYTLNNLGDDKDVSKLMNSDIIYYYDDGILYDKNRVKVMDYDLSIKKEEERKHFANVNSAPDKEFKAEYEDRMTDATELEESFMDAFNDCNYEVISADYTENGDKIIVSLNHDVNDIEAAAEHLMACLTDSGINILDWATNGNNVFIFDLDVDNAFDLDFDDYNVFGEKLTEAKENVCCICGELIDGFGNNPEPYMAAEEGRCCDGCNLKFVIPIRMEQMKED
jgi:hypothetical protein